jgi:PAS domain S-box-containing protein
MLSKLREEVGGITTLKVAQGSIGSANPPQTTSLSEGLVSPAEGSARRYLMDDDPRQSGQQLLASVSIVELLQQDERPTFIIDLANGSNFVPGPLQIIFANPSLLGHDTVLKMVLGKADLDSPGVVTNTFPEFKSWALSFVKSNEALDVCLPSFAYGGFTWTCSTLKRRLRAISGSITSNLGSSSVTASLGVLSCSPVTSHNIARSPLKEASEATDYFGNALNKVSSSFDQSTTTAPLVVGCPFWMGELPSTPSTTQSSNGSMRARDVISSFDWTRLPMSMALPRHIQFALSRDWESTSLGPIESWGFDLRAMCNLIMASPHPAAMYWGPEYIAIYNEPYILLAGERHPALMGQPYRDGWREIWDEIEPVFIGAKESGRSTMKEDDCLFMMRGGQLCEEYFSWSIIPLVGLDGKIAGLYNPAFEKTRRVIAERRMLTLREVGEKVATAQSVKEFWARVIRGLEYNERDVPFVFLYSVLDDVDSDMSSMNSGSFGSQPQVALEGSLGVPLGHPTALSPLDLKSSEESWAPYLREAMKTDKPFLLTVDDGTLSNLIDGLEVRGLPSPHKAAVVCPIHPTTGESILGFLVMGINPRRPYDDDYSLFVQLLCRQLATAMASVVLFEEEIRRGQKAARLAAIDKIELSKQLDLRTQEVIDSETKFRRMAEFAPVGMFIADSYGRITYCNDTWWQITRHVKEENSIDSWMDSLRDEDRDVVQLIWRKLVVYKIPVTHEFRVKAPFEDRNGNKGDSWVLMSAYPEKNSQGDLKSIFGSLTDISQQKWAEDYQIRRLSEAVELKRQQENFIDITSHEMRNPLSAILQCADEITTTLSEFRQSHETSADTVRGVIESSIDAAQTIALCAQHQKRIVDDILTLSKLDSALLLVTPVDVQPVAVVQRALKMFESELETNDIAMLFNIEKSYADLNVDWVKLDPSRLLQVLINLTTNAIKFTHTQEKREIIISIGASKQRPSSSSKDVSAEGEPSPAASISKVSYFPSRSNRLDTATGEDWGTGELLYLRFSVQDTGRGLSEDEKKLLFLRFSQTSPRTHVQYGGSGLGLFISRELTELQGGEIGVASQRDIGSTFTFYIKARQSAAPSRKNSSGRTSVTTSGSREHNWDRITSTPTKSRRHEDLIGFARATSAKHGALKVLIVEDNLVSPLTLFRFLSALCLIIRHLPQL